LPHLKALTLRLKTLDEVADTSCELVRNLPEPQKYRVGICELLVNAIEHGNLELGFELKTKLLREGRWEEEINRRLLLPEYRHREVKARFLANNEICQISIMDQGRGFAWEKHLGLIASGKRPNGRGLLIASTCGFDRLTFNPEGNQVTCVVRHL
jgi:anti-sigma regulatory factor (Ser/Thr protein kinase)